MSSEFIYKVHNIHQIEDKMRIIEVLGALQFLKKKLINFADLGEALGVSRAAISNRHQNSNKGYDELKPDEIKQLEVYFDVDIEEFVRKNTIPETNAQPSKQDKKELAKLIKETVTDMILEKGGQELFDKIFKKS